MYHDDEVRLIAYSLWEGEGRPDGHDQEHWFKAEAICQERQAQLEHVAEDVISRTDLPAPKVKGRTRRTRKCG